MSFDKRRTATVQGIIKELFAAGQASLRPGDVNAVLRERGMPMGGWEVRAEFTRLERAGVLTLDAPTGNWLPGQAAETSAG